MRADVSIHRRQCGFETGYEHGGQHMADPPTFKLDLKITGQQQLVYDRTGKVPSASQVRQMRENNNPLLQRVVQPNMHSTPKA